jgi:hypothetical protein
MFPPDICPKSAKVCVPKVSQKIDLVMYLSLVVNEILLLKYRAGLMEEFKSKYTKYGYRSHFVSYLALLDDFKDNATIPANNAIKLYITRASMTPSASH